MFKFDFVFFLEILVISFIEIIFFVFLPFSQGGYFSSKYYDTLTSDTGKMLF